MIQKNIAGKTLATGIRVQGYCHQALICRQEALPSILLSVQAFFRLSKSTTFGLRTTMWRRTVRLFRGG